MGFEILTDSLEGMKLLLCKLYTLLVTLEPGCDRAKDTWEQDLKIRLSNEQWQAINKYIQRFLVNVAIRANCYKVSH